MVDDNVDSVDSLAVVRGIRGHGVESADDGQVGLRFAARVAPPGAVLAIGVPTLRG